MWTPGDADNTNPSFILFHFFSLFVCPCRYKFVRMEFLDVVSLSEYPGSVANFVIHWPDGPRYYRCRDQSAHPMFTPSGPDDFMAHFANTSQEMNALLAEQMAALHERYGESAT